MIERKHTYHSYICLKLNDGYALPQDHSNSDRITINGEQFKNIRALSDLSTYYITGKEGVPAQDVPIREIHITGVPELVVGQYCTIDNLKVESVPQELISSQADYHWYDVTAKEVCGKYSTFKYGHEYSLYISVYPWEGVRSEKEYTATINGKDALCTYGGMEEELQIRPYGNLTPKPTVVHSVDVIDFMEPDKNERAGYALKLRLTGPSASEVVFEKWWDLSDDRYIDKDEYFQEGHAYRLDVVLKAQEGASYGYMPTCTLNDNQNLIDTDTLICTESEISFSTYEYVLPITKVNMVGYKTPVAGQTVEENLKDFQFSGERCFFIRKLSWWDFNAQAYLKSTGVFLAGRSYRLDVELEPYSTTYFRDNVVCNIVGETDLIDPYTLLREPRYVEFATNYITVEKLDTPVLTGVSSVLEGVEITWNSVENANCYAIIRRGADGSSQEVIGNTTLTTYVDTTAVDGETYNYSVICIISPERGTFLSDYDREGRTITYKKPVYSYSAPVLRSVENIGHCIQFHWIPVSYEHQFYKYEVLRKEENGLWKSMGVSQIYVYTDYAVEEGKTYTYTVRRVAEDGVTPISPYDETGLTICVMSDVIFTGQPANMSAAVGATATFRVAATGEGLKYQWKKSTDGGKTWVNSGSTGATTNTLSMTTKASYNGLQFKCVVTDKNGKVVESNAATLTVTAAGALAITTQPANATVTAGANVTFKIAATGDTLKYQWKKSTDGGKTWVNSSSTGATTNTLTMATKATYNGYKFKCVVTDKNGKVVESNAATLTVTAAGALAITTQPSNATVAAGANVTFKIAATGDTLKYQWKKSSDGGKTWANSSSTGATTNTLSMATKESYNGLQFKCVVTDKNGKTVTSNAATLKVTAAAALAITAQPSDTIVLSGATAIFKITATGDTLKYQWKKSTDGGKTWVNSSSTGATSNTLSMATKASYDGLQFKCVVTDKNGKTVTSNVATLKITSSAPGGVAAPAITTQPSNVTVTAGATATFKIAATGTGLKYQWKKSTDGGKTWVNSSSTGCTTNTLSMATKASFNGIQFKCVVTDVAGRTVTSNAATLTVK